MIFDVDAAKAAGHSEADIANFLGTENNFDTAGARKAGFSDQNIISELSGVKQPQEESDADKAARAEGKLIPEGESTLTSMGQAGIGALKSTVGGVSQFLGAEGYGKELAQAGAKQGQYYPSIADLPALYREKGLGAAASRLIPAMGYDVARTAPVIAGGIGAGTLATALAPEAAILGISAEALASTGAYGLAATGEHMNVQQRQIDEGTRKDFDRGNAAATGLVSGALERVGVQQILGKAGRIGESVAKKVGLEAGTAGEQALAASERTALARVGRGAAGTVGTAANEAVIETAQEALSRGQAGQSLTDAQAREAYLGSALGGFTMGGALHTPIAAYKGVTERRRADSEIDALGAEAYDVLSPDVNKPLTQEQFNEYGPAMAEGLSRMTKQEDGSRLKTPEQYYEELKNKVANPERDAEPDRIKARTPGEGIENTTQTQLEDEFAKGYEGPKQEQDLDIDAQKLEINKQAENRYNDIRNEFLNGSLKGANNKPVTSAAEANKIAIKEKNDHLKFNMELLNEEVESRNKRQEDIFGYKPTAGDLSTDETLPVNTEGEVLTPAEAKVRADADEWRKIAEKQHEDLVAAGIKSSATKEMSALLSKTKQGTQADLFGGKTGTLKEEPFTEEAKDYGTEPKQTDIEDEAKRLEVANLTARLRGLTTPIEGGPHPDILLGITPTTQQKVTDFKTAVHAEVGAKDDAVVTPEHIKAAGITGLELGNLVDKSGALPLTDKRVVEGINKLAPAKQQALINVLSKDYKPKNYISPSEQLISQADILNLGVGKQSAVGKLVPTPTSTINVLSNPKAAQQVISGLNKIISLPANKGTETAVKAIELKERIALTLAKVESTAKTTAEVAKTEGVTKDDVAYSVAPFNATTGNTVESLSKTLSPEMKKLVASGKAVIHDTQETLPGKNHPANVQGMTTADGVTHYVANKLTPDSMQNVALHEVGVHAGMEKMLGAKVWEDVKNQAMTNQGKEFDAARAAIPKDTPAHLHAEEALAYLVENSRHLPLVRRIIAAIRNFIRTTLGANINLTEDDARHLAMKSLRKEANTAERTARNEGTAYSISSENVPPLSNPKVKAKWQRIVNSASEKRAVVLHLFSAAGLNEIAGDYLPKELSDHALKLTRTIQGKVNEKLEEYIHLRRDINEFIKKHHAKLPIIGEVATEATLLGASLNMEGNNIQTKIDELQTKRPKGYIKDIARLNRLATNWNNLGEAGQKIYTKLATYYKQSHDDYINAQIANIESANIRDIVTEARIAKFKEQLAGSKLAGDYFPLQRFGNFGMSYTDGEVDEDTGELIEKFTKFESRNEAEDFLAAHPEVVSKGINKDFDREHLATGNKTLQDMWDSINKIVGEEQGGMSAADLTSAKNELKDLAFQMHLMGKPEQSIAKRFVHRKGTAGYSPDIFRGFDTYALSMSKQLPLIESSHEITVSLDALKKEVSKNPSDGATDYYSAFRREIEEAVYPKPVNVVARYATAAAFMYYLTSPASAVFQLASIPIMGAPSIGKRHGMVMAQGVLNAATTMYIASMRAGKGFGDIKKGAELNTNIQKLFKGAAHANEADIGAAVDQMRKEALLVPGLHAQTFSGKNKPSGYESGAPSKAYLLMEKASQPFAQMEKASREIVGVASYIANICSGMTHAEAVRNTIDTLYVDMGDFGETGRSSLSKTTVGRIAGQFQQYGAKLLFAMYKHAYLDMKKEVGKAQAAKYIGQLYLMHYVFAGALGMPLVGLVGMISDMFGDDDERQSFKDDIRSYLHEKNFNDTIIKLILDGPIGTVTHLDLRDRIGAADLIPVIQESDSNTSTTLAAKYKILGALGGASMGLVDNIERANQSFSAGEYGRAAENLLPAALKNVLMAGRYTFEGKKNTKGEDVIGKKDVGVWDVAARALGVETSDIGEKTRAARAVKQDLSFIYDRRGEILDKVYKSTGAEKQKAIAEARDFSKKHPGARIEVKDLLSSAKSRAKSTAEGNIFGGTHPGKNLPEEQRKHPELFDTENDYPDENED